MMTWCCLMIQPEPDFSHGMFDHGLTELFVGAGGANQGAESIQGDDLQQVGRKLCDAFFRP